MDDLISRKALLTELSALEPPGFEDSIAAKVAVKKIKEAPAVATEQRWIPVTERLPEHHSDVLVLDACGCEVAWLMDDGKWSTTLISDYPVTHWMELPEPPKEE